MAEQTSEYMSPVEKSEIALDERQTQYDFNKSILESIKNNGLLSRIEMQKIGLRAFQSADSLHAHGVNGVLFLLPNAKGINRPSIFNRDKQLTFNRYMVVPQPFNSDTEALMIKDIFYLSDTSILPVVMERPGDDYNKLSNLPIELLEDRMENSILIAVPARKLDLIGSSTIFGEKSVRTSIPADQIYATIVPNSLESLTRDVFGSTTRIITVDQTRKELLGRINATVPDYESAVYSIAKNTKEPFFLHIVRLASSEDKIPPSK